jgi:hypothetical protein
MTFTPEESGEIFKRDKMGRVRVPRARREALLDEYERSGISGVQFANYVGIKYSTLAAHIRGAKGHINLGRPSQAKHDLIFLQYPNNPSKCFRVEISGYFDPPPTPPINPPYR